MKFIQSLTLSAVVAAATVFPMHAGADEAKALAVLASDAGIEAKANACDSLGRVGTAKAVPVLAGLLADEKLHDYARDGLERIADPAAGQALLEALDTLEGDLLVGVVISLGDRGDPTAVPALAKHAKDSAGSTAKAALSSLAQIATDDAAAVIIEVLAGASAEMKVAAAHAALAAAGKMEKDGREEAAEKLRTAVSGADVPDHIKKAVE